MFDGAPGYTALLIVRALGSTVCGGPWCTMQVAYDGLSKYCPLQTSAWMMGAMEANIKVALDSLQQQRNDCLSGLRATLSPSKLRGVATLREFAKGEITLVPITSSILFKPLKDDHPSGSVHVSEHTDAEGTRFNAFLSHTGGIKMPRDSEEEATGIGRLKAPPSYFMAPFWLVREACDDHKPNLSVKLESCDVGNGLKIPVLTNTAKIGKGVDLYASIASLAKKKGNSSSSSAASKPSPSKRARKA